MMLDLDRSDPAWSLNVLRAHLQDALDLELWTIPYYLATMYSIRDPACDAFRLIQSVVNQEMLHVQLVGNLINAFGALPRFSAPAYGAAQIPHLDFSLDEPNPTDFFKPYSARLGPLDAERLNTMCLIEYPQWLSRTKPDLRPDRTEYGSIGEFYIAIRFGVAGLRDHLRPGVRQVDFFASYYNNLATTAITRDGAEGFRQAMQLIDAIVDQGEGQTRGDVDIPDEFQNTADGIHDSWPHFRKFMRIRESGRFPATYPVDPEPGPAGRRAQEILARDFAHFLALLDAMFQGRPYQGFGAVMARLGGEVLSCWQHGAVPRFS